MESQYNQQYEEKQTIGRGNFGAAYLCINKQEQKKYIAKKILLGSLSDKEQEGALMEVTQIDLRRIYQNIQRIQILLDTKIHSLKTEYVLTEVGDLGYHIKKRKEKNQHFTEAEIWNWFIQICLALDYIHGRKVLHRDLKASNIFLTGNNTVKLGDFGISRVLQNTNQHAMTVVGTPYYMSPEVCQNKPYSFKSDTWALGCVLYELCTLIHAFSADNLLGLVFKIVQGTYDPIPNHYSKDLSHLIQALLNKDDKQRPTVQQILQLPLVIQKAREYISTGGQSACNLNLTIRNTQQPELKEEQKMTPKQRMDKRKQDEIERKRQQLMEASREAHKTKNDAKLRVQEEFHNQKAPPAIASLTSQFDVNERTTDTFELSESLGTQLSFLTESPQINKFNSYDYEEHKAEEDTHQMNEVLDSYKKIVTGDYQQPIEQPTVEQPEDMMKTRMEMNKNQCKQQLGEDLYQKAYQFLREARQKEWDDQIIQVHIKQLCGQNKALQQQCFQLDQIVFMEIIQGF